MPMFENLIVIVAELGLISLFVLLAIRMSSLVRSEDLALDSIFVAPWTPPTIVFRQDYRISSGAAPKASGPSKWTRGRQKEAAIDRTELVTQLHILFGLQDRVCRSNHLILEESPDSIKCYAAAWLYGAATALTEPQQRHSACVVREVSLLMERKVGLSARDSAEAIADLTRCNIMLACYRNGLESAEHWQVHHFIPTESALNTAITSNAFV